MASVAAASSFHSDLPCQHHCHPSPTAQPTSCFPPPSSQAAAAGPTMTSLTDAVTSSVDVMTSLLVAVTSSVAAAAAAAVRDTLVVTVADSRVDLQAAANCMMKEG